MYYTHILELSVESFIPTLTMKTISGEIWRAYPSYRDSNA